MTIKTSLALSSVLHPRKQTPLEPLPPLRDYRLRSCREQVRRPSWRGCFRIIPLECHSTWNLKIVKNGRAWMWITASHLWRWTNWGGLIATSTSNVLPVTGMGVSEESWTTRYYMVLNEALRVLENFLLSLSSPRRRNWGRLGSSSHIVKYPTYYSILMYVTLTWFVLTRGNSLFFHIFFTLSLLILQFQCSWNSCLSHSRWPEL